MNGKKYLLSFTAFFNAEKEYILSFNCHQSIEIHNKYVVQTPVFNSYDGLIMWDMKNGSKVKLLGSIFSSKEGEIPFVDADSPTVLTSSNLMAYLYQVNNTLQTRLNAKEIEESTSVKTDIVSVIKETAQTIAAEIFPFLTHHTELPVGTRKDVVGSLVEEEILAENFSFSFIPQPLTQGEKLSELESLLSLEEKATRYDVEYGEREELTNAEVFFQGESSEVIKTFLSDIFEVHELTQLTPSSYAITPVGDLQELLAGDIQDLIADNEQLSTTVRLLEIMYGDKVVEQVKAELADALEAHLTNSTESEFLISSNSETDYLTCTNTYSSVIGELSLLDESTAYYDYYSDTDSIVNSNVVASVDSDTNTLSSARLFDDSNVVILEVSSFEKVTNEWDGVTSLLDTGELLNTHDSQIIEISKAAHTNILYSEWLSPTEKVGIFNTFESTAYSIERGEIHTTLPSLEDKPANAWQSNLFDSTDDSLLSKGNLNSFIKAELMDSTDEATKAQYSIGVYDDLLFATSDYINDSVPEEVHAGKLNTLHDSILHNDSVVSTNLAVSEGTLRVGAIHTTETAQLKLVLDGVLESKESAEILQVKYADIHSTQKASYVTPVLDGFTELEEKARYITEFVAIEPTIETASMFSLLDNATDEPDYAIVNGFDGLLEEDSMNAEPIIASSGVDVLEQDKASRKNVLNTRINKMGDSKRKTKKLRTKIIKPSLAIGLTDTPLVNEQKIWLITGKPYAWNNRNWAKTR